jgi:hypothetical protein
VSRGLQRRPGACDASMRTRRPAVRREASPVCSPSPSRGGSPAASPPAVEGDRAGVWSLPPTPLMTPSPQVDSGGTSDPPVSVSISREVRLAAPTSPAGTPALPGLFPTPSASNVTGLAGGVSAYGSAALLAAAPIRRPRPTKLTVIAEVPGEGGGASLDDLRPRSAAGSQSHPPTPVATIAVAPVTAAAAAWILTSLSGDVAVAPSVHPPRRSGGASDAGATGSGDGGDGQPMPDGGRTVAARSVSAVAAPSSQANTLPRPLPLRSPLHATVAQYLRGSTRASDAAGNTARHSPVAGGGAAAAGRPARSPAARAGRSGRRPSWASAAGSVGSAVSSTGSVDSTAGLPWRERVRRRWVRWLRVGLLTVLVALYATITNSLLTVTRCDRVTMTVAAYLNLDQDGASLVQAGIVTSPLVLKTCAGFPFGDGCGPVMPQLERAIPVHLLNSDPTIVCYESTHRPTAALAWVLLALFSAAVPLALGTLVWCRVRAVKSARGVAEHLAIHNAVEVHLAAAYVVGSAAGGGRCCRRMAAGCCWGRVRDGFVAEYPDVAVAAVVAALASVLAQDSQSQASTARSAATAPPSPAAVAPSFGMFGGSGASRAGTGASGAANSHRSHARSPTDGDGSAPGRPPSASAAPPHGSGSIVDASVGTSAAAVSPPVLAAAANRSLGGGAGDQVAGSRVVVPPPSRSTTTDLLVSSGGAESHMGSSQPVRVDVDSAGGLTHASFDSPAAAHDAGLLSVAAPDDDCSGRDDDAGQSPLPKMRHLDRPPSPSSRRRAASVLASPHADAIERGQSIRSVHPTQRPARLAVPGSFEAGASSGDDASPSPFSPAATASTVPGVVSDSEADTTAVRISLPSMKRTSLTSGRSATGFAVGVVGDCDERVDVRDRTSTANSHRTRSSVPSLPAHTDVASVDDRAAVAVVVDVTLVASGDGAGDSTPPVPTTEEADWTQGAAGSGAAAPAHRDAAPAGGQRQPSSLLSTWEMSNTAPGVPGGPMDVSMPPEAYAAANGWARTSHAAPSRGWELADASEEAPDALTANPLDAGTPTGGRSAAITAARRGGLPLPHLSLPLPAWRSMHSGQPPAAPAAPLMPSGSTVLTARFADIVALASQGGAAGAAAGVGPLSARLGASPAAAGDTGARRPSNAAAVEQGSGVFGDIDPAALSVTPELLLDNAQLLTRDPAMEFLVGKAYRASHLLFVVAELAVLLLVGLLLISWGEPHTEAGAGLQAAVICAVFTALCWAMLAVRPHKAEERYQAAVDVYVLLLAVLQTCINCLNTVVRLRYGLVASDGAAATTGGASTQFTADTLPDEPLVRGFRAAAYLVVAGAAGLFLLIVVSFVVVLWRGAELDAEAQRRLRFRQLTELARQAGRKSLRRSLTLGAAASGGQRRASAGSGAAASPTRP